MNTVAEDYVTVWDGKFIRRTTRELAQAGVVAGTMQYWDERNSWTPGTNMKYGSEFPFANAPTPTPTLDSLTPQTGPIGTRVEAGGTNFSEGSVVLLGTKVLATDYIDDTTLVFTIPKSTTVGNKGITVKNPDNDITGQMLFEVTAE